MEEVAFLMIMAMMFVLAGIASIIFGKLKMPAIIGYLAAGMVIANFWGIPEGDTRFLIQILSNIGLVLLMFGIGMELNIKKLKQSGAFTILVAAVQLPLMVLCGYVAGYFLGWNSVQSIFLGAVISGSSTAVVTAVLRSNEKISKDTADTIILVTVMEDIGQVIILTMASPLLVGQSPDASGMLIMIIGIIAFMAAAIVLGLLALPRLIDWIGNRFPHEILLITVLGMCFGMALLSTYASLSMAIGAFLMGLITSQSKYTEVLERDIEPMKSAFMAIFFIDVGLKIQFGDLSSNILLAVLIFFIFIVSKTVTVLFAYFLGNKDMKTSFISAMSLLAMGEFAFIVAKAALDAGAVTHEFYTAVVIAALISMITIPVFSLRSVDDYEFLSKHCPEFLKRGFRKAEHMRSDFYSKIVFSTKTTKRVRNRFTVVYLSAIAVFVIEVAFYIYGGDLGAIISEKLNMSMRLAHILVLLINLGAIAVPTMSIVMSLKVIDRIVLEGGKRKRGYYLEEDMDTRSAYSRFIGISNIFLVLMIDFAILLFVPNPLPTADHLIIMLGGIIAVLIVYMYKYYKKS
ncbi:MAG: cation:proton antiporter [Candidatus Methanomethylophilaceae archaeon]|jgi:CPA2 family monovalent cation:H+ antiporter-2